MLSRLVKSVKTALKDQTEFRKKKLWTDSQITLAWIKSTQNEYKTFVENRVQEIRGNTDTLDWFYCNTVENPADIITRKGIAKSMFSQNKLLWEDPHF